MLIHLSIKHFAVVEALELDFQQGMSVLSGETGAGKSILIDALQLTLGERADSTVVRSGFPFAELSTTYDLSQLPAVSHWLKAQSLDSEHDCVIRRQIYADGRSKSFINGSAVPLNQLRELGLDLVNIHGQHQHQALLKPDHQRDLLDDYAHHAQLIEAVKNEAHLVLEAQKKLKSLEILQGHQDKLALLHYQMNELSELKLEAGEVESLEKEHKVLTHAEQWLIAADTALNSLKGDNDLDAATLVNLSLKHISVLKAQSPKLNNCYDLLNHALIQIEEAATDLDTFKESLMIDPHRLQVVEQRLNQIHNLARKYRIQSEHIQEHFKQLQQEATLLSELEKNIEASRAALKSTEEAYIFAAKKLRQSRINAALSLEKLIKQTLATLEMPHATFKIDVRSKEESSFSPLGQDEVEFLVSTNPGLTIQPLRKIASGGELSRISLAIQVVTAQKMKTPILVFDEVDAGISGKTAETVGKLLKSLSLKTQVLCVTHLPQIAALGHHHYKVEKHHANETTTSTINLLKPEARTEEIARMLGGATITERALLHAKEMLEYA